METAINMVNKLRAFYHTDRFQFEFNCSMYISGYNNRTLRQQMMQIITGQKLPVAKCGLTNVNVFLKAYYEQKSLF